MVNKLIAAAATLLVAAAPAFSEEIEAVIDRGTRAFTKQAKSPEKFFYGRILLDSKERIVSQVNREGRVTKGTKVAMGKYIPKTKKWIAAEAIPEGVESELFTDASKTLRARITVSQDNVINQILITDADAQLEKAEGEFDAIYKGKGNTNFGGRVGFSYQRVELDDKGRIINRFPLTSTAFTIGETKVAFGKYNEKEQKWEAGEDIQGGMWGDPFKDPGARPIYVRLTYRDDHRGLAQILLCGIGEPGKK